MDFRDFDRKFWLIVEKGNKKITDLIGGCDGNAVLCYSYFNNKDGIVYTPLSSAVYINGDYSITKQGRMSWQFGNCYLFAKKQFNDFQIISINNKSLCVIFEDDIKRIEKDFYLPLKDLVETRDIRFIDEFRSEDNPDVLKGVLSDGNVAENIWIKVIKLLHAFGDKQYIFLCEIFSEPFTLKGIHKGDKTFAIVVEENSKKVCGCSIGLEEVEKLRKDLNLK